MSVNNVFPLVFWYSLMDNHIWRCKDIKKKVNEAIGDLIFDVLIQEKVRKYNIIVI